MTLLSLLAVVCCLAIGASAQLARAADEALAQELDPGVAMSTQTEILRGAPPDLSVVYIARLKFGDQQVDVTSLHPSLVGQQKMPYGQFVSTIRFSKDRSMLELFTRDPETRRGHYLAIPVARVPQTVTFPVLTDGKPVPTEITLLMIVHKP
jgi:hypothetical protein